MEEISNSSVDSVDWFLLVAYSKSWEERKKLNEELLSKKNLELEDLENSHPMILQKKKKKTGTHHMLWREHQGHGQIITFCYR